MRPRRCSRRRRPARSGRSQRLAQREAETIAQAKGEKLKRQCYQEVFGSTDAARTRAQKIVLADLARYCHARTTTFETNPFESAAKEGRRQVWLGRIAWFLNQTQEELTRLEDYLAQALGGL